MKLYKLFLTENACYKAGRKITPKGIMVHSTGANNPNLKRYVGPNDGQLGENRNGNHWNTYYPDGRRVCVHAFIGKLADGTVATYQTLPWDHRGWHSGGSGNDTHIGFEICEDGLSDSVYFGQVYREAVELCAHLCRKYNLTEKDIIDHSEGHEKGLASNHSDVRHWFPRHGKSMDSLRADVKKLLTGGELPQELGSTGTLYRVQLGAFSKKDNALRKLEAVKAVGIEDAFLVYADKLWRVQAGAFANRSNADRLLEELNTHGFSGFVTTSNSAVSSLDPEPSTPPKIKEGSTVRVRRGAKTYTGGGLAPFVYDREHKVLEIDGERIVITYQGTVVAAVHKNDLILV